MIILVFFSGASGHDSVDPVLSVSMTILSVSGLGRLRLVHATVRAIAVVGWDGSFRHANVCFGLPSVLNIMGNLVFNQARLALR